MTSELREPWVTRKGMGDPELAYCRFHVQVHSAYRPEQNIYAFVRCWPETCSELGPLRGSFSRYSTRPVLAGRRGSFSARQTHDITPPAARAPARRGSRAVNRFVRRLKRRSKPAEKPTLSSLVGNLLRKFSTSSNGMQNV